MLTKKDSTNSDIKKNSKDNILSKDSKPQTALATSPPKSIKPYSQANSKQPDSQSLNKKNQKTRIIIKYDTGFNNQLHIRGKGPHLSWEKGLPLKNVKSDEWLWETEDDGAQPYEFKVLLNDNQYEIGENHYLNSGATIAYSPHF